MGSCTGSISSEDRSIVSIVGPDMERFEAMGFMRLKESRTSFCRTSTVSMWSFVDRRCTLRRPLVGSLVMAYGSKKKFVKEEAMSQTWILWGWTELPAHRPVGPGDSAGPPFQ
jgi:hypothetical protein